MCFLGMEILEAHARSSHSPHACAVILISHNSFKFLAKLNNGLMPPFKISFLMYFYKNYFINQILNYLNDNYEITFFRDHHFNTSLGVSVLKQHKEPLQLVGVTFI